MHVIKTWASKYSQLTNLIISWNWDPSFFGHRLKRRELILTDADLLIIGLISTTDLHLYVTVSATFTCDSISNLKKANKWMSRKKTHGEIILFFIITVEKLISLKRCVCCTILVSFMKNVREVIRIIETAKDLNATFSRPA